MSDLRIYEVHPCRGGCGAVTWPGDYCTRCLREIAAVERMYDLPDLRGDEVEPYQDVSPPVLHTWRPPSRAQVAPPSIAWTGWMSGVLIFMFLGALLDWWLNGK